MIEFPRVISGALLDQYMRWDALNALNLYYVNGFLLHNQHYVVSGFAFHEESRGGTRHGVLYRQFNRPL